MARDHRTIGIWVAVGLLALATAAGLAVYAHQWEGSRQGPRTLSLSYHNETLPAFHPGANRTVLPLDDEEVRASLPALATAFDLARAEGSATLSGREAAGAIAYLESLGAAGRYVGFEGKVYWVGVHQDVR